MITGYVRGQQFRLSSPLIVADTIDYLSALFTFHTADWAGTEKWAHWQNGEDVFDVRLDEDDRITEDKHLNLSAGVWTVWVHGERHVDGKLVQRITTEKTQITVKPSGALNGSPFPEGTPSQMEEINARLSELEDKKLDPIDKTDDMTQPVGRDKDGRLWTSSGDIGTIFDMLVDFDVIHPLIDDDNAMLVDDDGILIQG